MMNDIYEYVYELLKEKNLLYLEGDAMNYSITLSYYYSILAKVKWAKALEADFLRKYDRIVAMNCMKFHLAAKSFNKEINREAIDVAVCFVVLGCVLDDLIDHGSKEEKEIAFLKLQWDSCKAYFEEFEDAKDTDIIDEMFEHIGQFMKQIKSVNEIAYQTIILDIKQAITSELFVGSNQMNPANGSMFLDKSILFVLIGFKLAMSGNISKDEKKVYCLIGNVFRIIDDICDIEQDMENTQLNSIIYYASQADISIKEQIEVHVQEMWRDLKEIKKYVDEAFYHFILYEVREWTLSNKYIRQRIFEV